jgi:hypothetical protein
VGGGPLGLRLAMSVYVIPCQIDIAVYVGGSCRSLRALRVSACRFGFADEMRRTCPVRIRLGIFDVGAVWMSVGGPNVGIGMGRHGVGDKKKLCFW